MTHTMFFLTPTGPRVILLQQWWQRAKWRKSIRGLTAHPGDRWQTNMGPKVAYIKTLLPHFGGFFFYQTSKKNYTYTLQDQLRGDKVLKSKE